MALSTQKRNILNNLPNTVPGLRQGQISPSDGGDIRLGDLLGNVSVVSTLVATITASPTVVTATDAKVGDVAFVQLTLDDTGGALGALSATVTDGSISVTPASGPTNDDGTVLILLLREQS